MKEETSIELRIGQQEQLTSLKFRNQQLLDELNTQRTINTVHEGTIRQLSHIIFKHRNMDFLERLGFLFTGTSEE